MEKIKVQTPTHALKPVFPLQNYLLKMKTVERTPLKVLPKNALMGFLGGFLTILTLALLTKFASSPWLMAPFGASCVLAFSVWDAPLSQPRNIIGGHFISTFVGLLVLQLLGNSPWSVALGVGLAIACMVLTKTTHPPAGADPIVVILGNHAWGFLLFPTLSGAIIIVLIALLINNMNPERRYPKFWI